MPAINAQAVTVDLPVYDSTGRSLKHALLSSVKIGGTINRDRKNRVVVRALNNVSLSLRDDDRIGLIGRNGAGKSTLLRVLAGIYPPTRGHVTINGRISALFSLTSMIDPEMTGFENIEYASILLGITPSGRKAFVQEIQDFTELGEFLTMPVRTYSSGMQVRLSFGLLTAQAPEILLLDEAVGAGDAHFVDKAMERTHSLFARTNIVMMASHSESLIRQMCNKVLWLDHGSIRQFGPVDEVLHEYNSEVMQDATPPCSTVPA
jgi:ABC-2 type transport system ATP-binding protein